MIEDSTRHHDTVSASDVYKRQILARVARKYVLTIEPVKGHQSHRQYPWDIVREFEAVGLKVLDKRIWSTLWTVERKRESEWSPDFDAYEAILFAVPPRSITPDSEQPL